MRLPDDTIGQRWLVYSSAMFLLNFLWESWHAVYLYAAPLETMRSQLASYREFVALISYASLVDAGLLLALLLLGVGWWRDWRWYEQMTVAKYAFFVGAAVVAAAWIEYKALYLFEQWAYSELMPTVLGLGLSPLIQLAATGLVGLWLVRRVGT